MMETKMPKPNKALTKAEANQQAKEIVDAAIEVASTVDVAIAKGKVQEVKDTIAIADKTLSPALKHLCAIANEVAAGPVSVLENVLKPAYGGNQVTTKDAEGNDVLAWEHDLTQFFPRPVADAKVEKESNAPLKEYFDGSKPDGQGGYKTVKCNFFTEALDDLAYGKELNFQIDQCDMRTNPKRDSNKCEQYYKDLSDDRALNLYEKLKKDKARARKIVRQAVGIHYVFSDMAEHVDRVLIEYDGTDLDSLSNTQYPINLIDVTKTRVSRPITVGDAMRIDVAGALADAGATGNLYDKIIAQLMRGKKDKKTESVTFADFDEARNAVLKWINYYDFGTEEGGKRIKLLQTTMLEGKRGKPDPVLIKEVGTMQRLFTRIWTDRCENLFLKYEAADAEKEAAQDAA